MCHENEFPMEYVTSSLHRMIDYMDQHLQEIKYLSKMLLKEAPRCREDQKRNGRVYRPAHEKRRFAR